MLRVRRAPRAVGQLPRRLNGGLFVADKQVEIEVRSGSRSRVGVRNLLSINNLIWILTLLMKMRWIIFIC